ncbi:MAG: RHS repeat-associated core domain-containing protein [Pirellulales bacterium]
MTELVALDRTGDGLTTTNDNESTKYLYEDTNDASLVTNEIYPDSSDTASSGTDQVKKEYFFNGQLKRKTDQRGVVIDYEYNADRALEWEKVTTLPSGVDGTVRSIQRTYDNLRRPLEVRSFATSTGTTYVNEIEYTYDDNLGVKFSYQDHDSAVSTGSTPYVSYFYDVTAVSGVFDDGLRRYAYGLPSGGGYVWEYYTSTIADRLHRIESITETFSTGTAKDIASYAYNGTGRLVSVSYAQPAFKLLRDEGSDGTYEHLDQFGRVKVQHWKANGGSTVDRVEYAYDYASNRTLRDIPSSLYGTNNLDQTYGYDGLNRLKNFDQGVYTTSIASPTQEQDWTLDMLGNWSNLLEKTSGSTTLNQNRTHNNANEIATIAGASTYVGHDAAGNMTKIPKPTNWSAAYDLVFDPWNRIVQVKDGGSTVATYGYDGLHRRVTKTVGGTTEQHYYNENWQCVEVRVGTESGPARQKYIWHPYYIDALACRFADVDSNGNFSGTDEVEFPTHDANFNVTALVNAAGTVFERYYYSPYGKLSVLDANFAADADGASDVANSFTYTGRQLDSESGIYQYRNRYYHAQLGRFIGRDPIGYGADESLYASWRVVQSVDPYGLYSVFDLLQEHGDTIAQAAGKAVVYGIKSMATYAGSLVIDAASQLGNDLNSIVIESGQSCVTTESRFQLDSGQYFQGLLSYIGMPGDVKLYVVHVRRVCRTNDCCLTATAGIGISGRLKVPLATNPFGPAKAGGWVVVGGSGNAGYSIKICPGKADVHSGFATFSANGGLRAGFELQDPTGLDWVKADLFGEIGAFGSITYDLPSWEERSSRAGAYFRARAEFTLASRWQEIYEYQKRWTLLGTDSDFNLDFAD